MAGFQVALWDQTGVVGGVRYVVDVLLFRLLVAAVAAVIFWGGFVAGWRGARKAIAAEQAAAERARLKASSSRGAGSSSEAYDMATEGDSGGRRQQRGEATAEGGQVKKATYPQVVYVTTLAGSQYHVDEQCGGLSAAKSKTARYACLTCVHSVDGDGYRRRARER